MLKIKTFAQSGKSSFFKAIGHPEIGVQRSELIRKIRSCEDKFCLYDPESRLIEFLQLMGLSTNDFARIFIQKVEDLSIDIEDKKLELVSEINSSTKHLIIISFDSQKHHDHIKHLLSADCEVVDLKSLKLPEHMISDVADYLSPLNFSTNFAWFKGKDGMYTRLITANYWAKYKSENIKLFAYLIDDKGIIIRKWERAIGSKISSIVIDSKEIKKEFNLGDGFGQLFLHFVGTKGHDIVKYALDVYSDDGKVISATHDANAWPSDYFAGLPAPREHEKVILWLQNSHPITIAKNTISLNIMGESTNVPIEEEIPPYGTLGVDVAKYFPHTKFPKQLEIHAGKYFVRPRYEVITADKRCIAHVNVERDDLQNDPNLKNITKKYLGKGFILPAPILPLRRFDISILPTPMATSQKNLPLKAIVYSAKGVELAEYKFGNLKRDHDHALNLNQFLADKTELSDNGGNIQIVYDFDEGDDADGWVHGIVKFFDKDTKHFAETSFGSHIFNNITTYKNEPQSYKGPPPGLSTSLFLRIGPKSTNTHSYLIYPVSKEWHPYSNTEIALYDNYGNQVEKKNIKISANGSFHLNYRELFGADLCNKLENPYIIITDKTCRLFGYHMLTNDYGFSLDHMFGF